MLIKLSKCYDNHHDVIYKINGEVIDSHEVVSKLALLGVDIKPAQLQFITTKHRVPKAYSGLLEYDDETSDTPTSYYVADDHDEEVNPTEVHIDVDIYVVAGKIDHSEYTWNGHKYIRLQSLCDDLESAGVKLARMQLRNCIHREIPSHVSRKYPNLEINKKIINA
jgi:hypothetical protein